MYYIKPVSEIIYSKINLINVGQDTQIQYLDQHIMTNIVKNYFSVLEVLSSLTRAKGE